MIELRIHGRGGQGAVVASIILAKAFSYENYYVQCFPEFGVERRGSPVQAFFRADKKPIYNRTKIYHPNQIIVLDQALIKHLDVTAGLADNATIIINSGLNPEEFEFSKRWLVATVNASDIAIKYKIGTETAPIANTTILGAYVRATNLIKLDSLIEAVKDSISGKKAEDNIKAVKEAYEMAKLSNSR